MQYITCIQCHQCKDRRIHPDTGDRLRNALPSLQTHATPDTSAELNYYTLKYDFTDMMTLIIAALSKLMIQLKIQKQPNKTHFLDFSNFCLKYECYNLLLPDYFYLACMCRYN